MARQPRPVRRLLTFLDPLFRRAALVVEVHYRPARQVHVRDKQADAPEQLAWVMHDLGDDRSQLPPTFGLT